MTLSRPERYVRESGRDYALRVLRENIISLELEPGSMVSENELAAQLGLSRTPVREALIELSKVKIVEIWPQKGSAIARIDYALVEEARFMRNVLECAVAELCCDCASVEDILALRENIARQRTYETMGVASERFLHLDDSFHAKLFEIAGKTQVYTLIGSISIHFDRVRNLTLADVNVENVIRDHAQLVDAIEQKKSAEAKRLMQLHLNRFRIAEKKVQEKFPDYFIN